MDVDFDLQPSFNPKDIFDVTLASMVRDGKLVKHPAGVYFQNIPVDKFTDLSAIPYKEAEKVGYFKIDFLHLNILDNFDSKEELRALLKVEPDWSLFEDVNVVERLFQINKQFDIVYQILPTSIMELADTIALIRPGKRKFLNAYIKKPEMVRQHLYKKPEDGSYYFKKGHAISYALTIVLQLHLIKADLLL